MQAPLPKLCHKVGITVEDFLSHNREAELVKKRRLVWDMLYKKGYSSTEIGQLANRNHSSIIDGLNKLPERKKAREKAAAARKKELAELEVILQKKKAEEFKKKYPYHHLIFEKVNRGLRSYKEYLRRQK